MILWHFTQCGEFLKGSCVLISSGNYTHVEISAGGPYIVDDFFSTFPGKNFDMCINSTRTKTH